MWHARLIRLAVAGGLLAMLAPSSVAHAQDVVFGFDSSPASGPPGTVIDVSGSKCGAVIGSIEGVVTVSVVSEPGGVEIGAGIFNTFNTNWQGPVTTSPDAAAGTYLVKAHCSTYAEVDYPPNTFVVTGASQPTGTVATAAPTGPASAPASTPSTGQPAPTVSSGGSTALIVVLLAAAVLVIAGLVAWRFRSRRQS
jgi:hypothetical protein